MSRTIAPAFRPGKAGHGAIGVALAAFLFLAAALPAGPARALSAQDVGVYTAAFAAADAGRYDEALSIANAARERLPAKVIEWMRLSAPGAAFDDIAIFLRDNPDWPNRSQLRRNAERSMPPNMSDRAVLGWFKENPPVGLDGVTKLARALLNTGDRDAAAKLVRERWVEGTFGPADQQAYVSEFGGLLRAQDHRARLDHLLWERSEDAAKRMVPLVGAQYAALVDARFKLHEDRAGADAAVARVPASLQNDAGLLYDRARYRRRKDNDQGALEILMNPPKELGRPALWWTERHILARRFMETADYRGAYRTVSGHRQEDGAAHADAEFLAGWLALRFLNRPQDAFRHFQTLYKAVSSPISRGRGAYWSGRAADAMGETQKAREWYRTAAGLGSVFYGQLAASRLGESVKLPAEPKPSSSETAAFEKREVVRAARMLAQIEGADDSRVTAFVRRLSLDAKAPEEFALAARLALSVNRPDLAVAAAKDAAQADVALTVGGYPVLPSRVRGGRPEPALVHAIIRQESTFNGSAVSGAGARGLMQIMPGTAKQVARQLGEGHKDARLISDPDYNIRLGSAYLADLIDRFNGSYILAIASYNAGPGRISGWINTFGDPRTPAIDPVDWIEHIPFSETRNYVQRVMEALIVYRGLLDGGRGGLDLERELRR